MTSISRRDCLKLAGGLATSAAILPFVNLLSVAAEDLSPAPTPFGRVAELSADIRAEATRTSTRVRVARRDEVFPLLGQVQGQAVMPYNNVWFKIDGGYVYSSWVQPVQNIKNDPLPDEAAGKFWGEVSVPFTDSRTTPDPKARRYMRLEYGTIYHVIGAVNGKDGQWWYQLKEGISGSGKVYVPASDIHRIDPADLSPLSPDVKDKRIEVSLKAQRITAYEGDKAVLTSLVCSGTGGFGTPRGNHKVLFKTPTSRMIGGSGTGFYDLPGVPFPTFITWSGVAIHGTYWHNDYGRPRSHGCLNVPSDVARWFWRWTLPSAPYDKSVFYTRTAEATVVHVV
jgi:lipoprotein-anchoring transpeptidase ErfK/SrfK